MHAVSPGPGLLIDDVTVRYGGLVAVNRVSVEAPLGRITGLIGPNGAGKTSTFAACNGVVRPASGRVHLFGHDVTSLSPQARAQRGLGRTNQRVDLFPSLTVAENVGLGLEARLAGSHPWRQVRTRRADLAQIRRAVGDALQRCGIAELADVPAGNLATGQARLVELARAIAGGFDVLLLDEPSSGLDRTETTRFGDVLRGLVSERGTGILLVEHDMSLVLSICDYVYVLDFGQLLFEGIPAEVVASPIVRDAYLGAADAMTIETAQVS